MSCHLGFDQKELLRLCANAAQRSLNHLKYIMYKMRVPKVRPEAEVEIKNVSMYSFLPDLHSFPFARRILL